MKNSVSFKPCSLAQNAFILELIDSADALVERLSKPTLNREFLSRLRCAGARLDDIDHLDLFADFNKMVADGLTVSYAVSALAQKYGVSQRLIYAIVRRLRNPRQL